MNLKGLLITALWTVVFVAIGILFYLHFADRGDYVYVDSQKLVNGYKGMQDARREYETKVSVLRSNLDTLRREVEVKVKEYEAKKDKLNTRERSLMEELIKTKHEQFMNYQQIVQEKIESADQELTSTVVAKINDYIKRYGKSKGHSIIMAATQHGNIVYAEDSKDITDEILKGLNAEYGR